MVCGPGRYDDGRYSGGMVERSALLRLLADLEAGRVDCVVAYKVDRLSRSLLGLARVMAVFDAVGASKGTKRHQYLRVRPGAEGRVARLPDQ